MKCWEERPELDSANTGSFVGIIGSDSNVALFSPGCAPWISDDVVILFGGLIVAISNCENNMVSVDSALLRVKDALFVVLEHLRWGGNGHWYRLLVNSRDQSLLILGGNCFETAGIDYSFRSIIWAVFLFPNVWVITLQLKFVSLKIGESMGCPSVFADDAALLTVK